MSDLFISYSRDDREFVEKLHLAVEESGRDTWLDKFDIPKGEKFWTEIEHAIDSANTFVFVITPTSIEKSAGDKQYCRREIEYAAKQGKRIIPIVYRDRFNLDDRVESFLDKGIPAHQELTDRNWLEFQESNFSNDLAILLETSEKDLEYVKLHTKLLEEAKAWSQTRSDSKLRRADSLIEAEEWLRLGEERTQLQSKELWRENRDPEPTSEHRNFIIQSRKAENARLEREKLDREAKEDADKKINWGTKILAGTVVGAIGAAGLAGYFIDQAKKAVEMRSEAQLGTDLEREGAAAMEEFKSDQTKGLLSAMRSVTKLKVFEKEGRSIETYPAASPLLALQTGLDKIRETVIKADQRYTTSVNFSPDGKTLVTAGGEGIARIWDTSGVQLAQLTGHQESINNNINTVSFSPDGKTLVTGGSDRTARIWDTSGVQLAQLTGHQGSVNTVSFSPDGKTLITSGPDDIPRIWNISGKQLAQITGHQGIVTSVTFSPDGKSLATSGEDGTTRIWDISGKQLTQIRSDQGRTYSVSFSPDGKTLVTAGGDGTIRIWDILGKQLTQIKSNQKSIFSVSFSPDGKTLVTAGKDGTIRIWDILGKQLTQIKSNQESIHNVSFSPDSKILAATESGTVYVWDTSGKQLVKLTGHQTSVHNMSFSPDSTTLVTNGDNGTVHIWDISGKQLTQLTGHQGSIYRVTFSPDGKTLVTNGDDDTPRIWDISGKQLAQLKKGDIFSASFSPDSKTLLTGGDDGTARIWDISGKQLAQLTGHQGSVNTVSFSPDGKTLVTNGYDGTARIWDTSGKQLTQLTGHQGGLNSVSFSPDSKTLVTSGGNGTAHIWDTSGKQFTQLIGHQGSVDSVSFNPNGKTLVTSGNDNTVRIWDTSGRQIAQYDGKGYVNSNWTYLATVNPAFIDSNDRIVILHPLNLSPTALLDRACKKLENYLKNSPELKADRKRMCNFD